MIVRRFCLPHLLFILLFIALFSTISFAHLLVRTDGGVFYKPEKNANFRPIGEGDRFSSRGLIKSAPGTKTYIFCDNIIEVKSLTPGTPFGIERLCSSSEISIEDVDDILRSGKQKAAGVDTDVPFTISPRLTFIADRQPDLNWNRVEGAKKYTVRLFNKNGEQEWEIKVKEPVETPVPYPVPDHRLEFEESYLLKIITDTGGSSLLDPGACYGFEVLMEEEIKDLKRSVDAVRKLSELTPTEQAIVQAHLYRKKDCFSEAVVALESVAKKGTKNALVYRELGDLFKSMSLHNLSEKNYVKALELYTQNDDNNGDRDAYGSEKTKRYLKEIREIIDTKGQEKEKPKDYCKKIILPGS